MWYYINKLQKGYKYKLEEKIIEFIEKKQDLYYFYVCKSDEWSFEYIPTPLILCYKSKELNYIKKVQECSKKGTLKRIGRDKVFIKN